MDNFLKIYENSNNPLENNATIEKIIKAYRRSNLSKSFYDSIIMTGAEAKEEQSYPEKDMDFLYSTLFNTWKSNMIRLKESTIHNGHYEKIIKILETIPNISTYEEFKENEKKYPIIKQYGMMHHSDLWVYLSSRYIKGTRENDMKAMYRFYINAETSDIYKLISIFIYKCYEKNLPYDLKFIKYAEDLNIRADSIVIWADDKTVFEYMRIFDEIKEKRPDIVSRCKEPPILTMPIHNWIGFGEEPKESSYTDYRIKLLREAIEKSILEWIIKNENTLIRYGKAKFTVKEYIAAKSLKEEFKIIERGFNTNSRAPIQYGMKKEELNKELYCTLCNYIKELIIPTLKNGESRIKYTLGTKKISVFLDNSVGEICDMIITSNSQKGDFFETVRKNIKNNSKKYEIDPEKFILNSNHIEKIGEQEK